MDLIGNEHDMIIVTGCNAAGKTTTSNYLRTWAKLHNIPHEDKIVTDSQYLFEAMQEDDQAGGLHHTHDWCMTGAQGHSHCSDQPLFPFTVTDNELPNQMRQQFFTKLTALSKTGKLWFVEWAAGVNTNPREDPASCIDYSYAKVKRMLHEESLPDSWLKRVRAIIHLEADFDVRLRLNKRRSIPALARPEALEQGTAFWLKNERILRFYGFDDFDQIEDRLQAAGVSIYALENDGGSRFYQSLESVANALFLPSMRAFPHSKKRGS